MVMLLPTNVYAEKDNSDGSDSGHVGGATNKEPGRVYGSYAKTGWLIYVAKKAPKVDGEERGEATVVGNKVVYARATSQNDADPSKYNRDYLTSRLKDAQGYSLKVKIYDDKDKLFPVAKWGTPFDGDQKSRAGAIRNEILNIDKKHYYSSDHNISNVVYIIKHYLGQSVLDEYLKDPNNYYLILEPCAMHTGYKFAGGSYTKYEDYVASAYGWGCFYKDKKSQTYGDGKNGWCDNCCLPRSCYLDENWPSLPKKPTSKQLGSASWGANSITYETLTSFVGLGMMAYKTNLQTTCNENEDEPHHPVPEANGDYTIIKNYVIKNGDGTYTHKKCTSKTNSFEVVKVEQEEKITGYKLVAWRVTTKRYPDDPDHKDEHYPQDLFKKAVDSKGKLSWFDEVPGTKKDEGATKKDFDGKFVEINAETVNIKELGGNTVFLLLIKDVAQSTCDEKEHDPHPAPNESKGDYKIIKNYVTKTGDTYKDDGCHVRKSVTNVIQVEDEAKTTGYKLKAWKTSTQNDGKEIAAVKDEGLVWEENVPKKWMKEGKKPATVDLKEKGKAANTLYLLLIKEEEDIQTTCDEDKPTPHPAPNESKGTYKIVKNYVTKTDDTYTDDGCYSRTNVANKIKIEDEAKTTGYHLEAWKVSTNTNSPVTSVDKHSKLVWDENVPATVKKSGTTPKTVDLKEKGHEGKTVYLLLVRDKSKVQTTCDEPIPTPHPAPNESTGTYKIVKNYVTDSNGKYKDDGCFCKTKVTHQIKIEDESSTTGYTLVAWKATDSSTESVTSVAGFIFLHFFRCANIM